MQKISLGLDPEFEAHKFLEHYCLNYEAGKYSEYELYNAFSTWSEEQGIEEQERCRVLSAAYSMLGR